jgi:hypothetical protein
MHELKDFQLKLESYSQSVNHISYWNICKFNQMFNLHRVGDERIFKYSEKINQQLEKWGRFSYFIPGATYYFMIFS